MLKLLFLVTAIVLSAIASPALAQDIWSSSISCTVTAPVAAGKPALAFVATVRTDTEGATIKSLQVRIQSENAILADKEKVANVSIKVGSEPEFGGLSASGSVGKTSLIVIAIPNEMKILPAFSRGASAIVTLPAASGEKKVEIDLKGSGAAIKQILARCG